MANLDRRCADAGCAIAAGLPAAGHKDRESHVNKSLGILMEDGVYAFFLYQRVEREGCGVIVERECYALLAHEEIALLGERRPIPEGIADLTDSLPQLLLAKQLLERALIYARYHIKAGV